MKTRFPTDVPPRRASWGGWLILYAIGLHFTWGAMLLWRGTGLKTTPLYTLGAWLQTPGKVGLVLVTVAGLTTLGLFLAREALGLLLMMPQQIVLILTAGGALSFAVAGVYPDGYHPDEGTAFIFQDQMPVILLALLHTLAIFDYHGFLVPPRLTR
jgi:hypothetical protein